MGSNLDQAASFDFFQEDPINSICIILLTRETNGQTEKQTYGHENNASLTEVTIQLLFSKT